MADDRVYLVTVDYPGPLGGWAGEPRGAWAAVSHGCGLGVRPGEAVGLPVAAAWQDWPGLPLWSREVRLPLGLAWDSVTQSRVKRNSINHRTALLLYFQKPCAAEAYQAGTSMRLSWLMRASALPAHFLGLPSPTHSSSGAKRGAVEGCVLCPLEEGGRS